MDKVAGRESLKEGAGALGVALSTEAADALLRFRDELLKWNQRVSLTAITDRREVLEKHFVDSLAVLPEVGDAKSLLDLGAGAGLPGIPLKLARPELSLTLVDTVGKKVMFLKNALAALKLVPSARALHARAEGDPDREGIPRAEVVISRAFMDVGGFVPLAAKYLAPGGRVVAMLGQKPGRDVLENAGGAAGLKLLSVRSYTLPWSGAARAVAVFG
ncbi:MAG: 16S rRNA (guanine(527)-N(7))-methyltransferase RsmG [Myxococcaceae bacterium]|nr:16S rRNA (guanine(527)-N(7))-methyltransferase RsmG [Myxococcaceae bacterium]